jgi:hypothetical protein
MMGYIAFFFVGVFAGLFIAWFVRGWISDEGQY